MIQFLHSIMISRFGYIAKVKILHQSMGALVLIDGYREQVSITLVTRNTCGSHLNGKCQSSSEKSNNDHLG